MTGGGGGGGGGAISEVLFAFISGERVAVVGTGVLGWPPEKHKSNSID